MKKFEPDKFIDFLNDSILNGQKLSILNKQTVDEYKMIEKQQEYVSRQLVNINYIIIGEATQSFNNYFYNPKSNQTVFLNPKHFGLESKADLLDFFKIKGILVFDLYPLPLPTFIYDKIPCKFKKDEQEQEYINHLKNYFDPLRERLARQALSKVKPTLVLRYSKLKERTEWAYFKKYFEEIINIGSSREDLLDISSKGMGADKEKIKDIFLK